MTDREKAIVMAYTGICMLTGDKLQIFHKYVEDIMDRSVWTHEMALDSIADEIRAKSKDDFIALCADESSSENPNRWIPVSERLPEVLEDVLVCDSDEEIEVGYYRKNPYAKGNEWYIYGYSYDCEYAYDYKPIAWMPLPEPYKAESEVEE